MRVPFLDLRVTNKPFENEYFDAFKKFLDTGWYVLGDGLKNFEHDYAKFNNTKYCVGVGNGLDALVLSLKALGIDRGDEVIVPSNTYIATWLAVVATGATPIPVEPKEQTFNIDPDLIEEKITHKTKAIIPVHLFGQICEMDEILNIAKKYNLFIVEDNAQAQGAKFKNKISGSFGDVNATSFYPGKNLGALGDGGAITTDNKVIAEKISILRNYGSGVKYHNEIIGTNSRLDELQALFLSIKLRKLEHDNFNRIKAANNYNYLLSGVGDLKIPTITENSSSVYHLYVIRTDKRDKLVRFLSENGVGTLIHYPIPPHLQNAFKSFGYKVGDFPIAEKMADTSLSIPLWPGISKDEINLVADTIKEFFRIN